MAINDTRMMAKSVQQRWPMSSAVRDVVIQKLIQVMASKESSPREITAAARALMSAEKQNQEDEHAKIDEFRTRVLAIAERCGINIDLHGASQEADSRPEASNRIDLEPDGDEPRQRRDA